MNGKRFIVGGRIPVVLTSFEHKEDCTQELVRQSDDSAFMATTNDQGLEFRLEDRLGTAGGMCELAQQATDMEIALTDAPGFVLASRFVIAGQMPTQDARRSALPKASMSEPISTSVCR